MTIFPVDSVECGIAVLPFRAASARKWSFVVGVAVPAFIAACASALQMAHNGDDNMPVIGYEDDSALLDREDELQAVFGF